LAAFVRLPPQAVVADLGTGCGVIPLVLARKSPDARCVAFENNPDMAAIARENVCVNGLDGRIEIICEDIIDVRTGFPVSSFDVVVSNPPFRSPHSGKTSPHIGRDTARHESSAGLADFLASAKYLVKPSGRMFFIYPPSRLAEFICCVGELKLAILRLRMVHGNEQAAAKMFMVELAKGRRGDVTVEAPLIVYDTHGGYSDEVARMLGIDT
ncbi:MAG: methyltransferase, partial [Geobacteraceae bacterium]|nr:methyltransferase [Geobacteraceae bacterium]